jgi:ribosomal protein S18 acetylase RimI-like enzyme
MSDLSVCRYRPSDGERVRELHVAAMREFDAFNENEGLDDDLMDVQEAYLDGGEFLVGTVDGDIVAMGAFRPAQGYITEFVDGLGDAAAEVKRMRVDPARQRQGYGQRVYDELERRARDRGFDEFVLDTSAEQSAAQRFYEANGFHLDTRQTVQPGDEQFELLCYRKELD